MRKTLTLSTALLVVLLFIHPFLGWAEMNHHGGESRRLSGDHQDMGMSAHYKTMKDVFENYFAIQASLAEDSMEHVPPRAKAMAETIESLQDESMKWCERTHEGGMHALMSDMGAAAGSLAEQKDIDPARREFGKLSEKLVEYRKGYGKDQLGKAYVFVCDMAKQVWLQDSDDLRNPYYGSAMLKCGRRAR